MRRSFFHRIETRRVATRSSGADKLGFQSAKIRADTRAATCHVPILAAIYGALFLTGCSQNALQNTATTSTRSNQVVMYCSVDEVYARPILRALEAKTGLRIKPLFDVEASKTAGLASRIRAERNSPRADVFWSSATLQTLLLSREGLLEKFSVSGNKTSAFWYGNDWIATGVRARVIVYNAAEKQPPRALDDLLLPRFKNKIGISNPLFGTGSDWSAALATRRGHDNTLDYFRRLKANGAKVLPGNSVVAERVGRGELLAGVTDTDDFLALQKQFPDLRISLPTNENLPNDLVFIPMTAAILKGAPHLQNAQKLMNAFSSPEIGAQIVKAMPGVLPLCAGWNDVPSAIAPLKIELKNSRDDTDKWTSNWQKLRDPLADMLLRD